MSRVCCPHSSTLSRHSCRCAAARTRAHSPGVGSVPRNPATQIHIIMLLLHHAPASGTPWLLIYTACTAPCKNNLHNKLHENSSLRGFKWSGDCGDVPLNAGSPLSRPQRPRALGSQRLEDAEEGFTRCFAPIVVLLAQRPHCRDLVQVQATGQPPRLQTHVRLAEWLDNKDTQNTKELQQNFCRASTARPTTLHPQSLKNREG